MTPIDHPHAYPAHEVVELLETDAEVGLTVEEARARLTQYGTNELQEWPRPGLLAMLWNQFDDFVVWMLIVAAGISALVGYYDGEGYTDAIAIVAIVILNAVIGLIQERRAENALRALKKMASPDARVVRDGCVKTIPSREVVPGDIVLLETGNYVPSDVRLVEAVNLKIEEASLTGESVPVVKHADAILGANTELADRTNTASMGTIVAYGRGRGVVVNTGMSTQIGRIAEMIQTYEEEETPLQRRLNHLGRALGYATLVVCGIVFGVSVVRDTAVGTFMTAPLAYLTTYRGHVLELFMVAVSLAIAAVPEGLPAVVTITLALGMQRMIRRHALIRRLPAVETLGSATTICADKTGTLTQNEMMVVQVELDGETLKVGGEGYRPAGAFSRNGREVDVQEDKDLQVLLQASLLASDAVLNEAEDGRGWVVAGDPTEGALVTLAAKGGYRREELESKQPRVAEIPFDSERKRMTTVHDVRNAHALPEGWGPPYIAYVKGAPDVIVDLSDRYHHNGLPAPLTDDVRERIARANERMASRALRVLAIAYKPLDEVPEELSSEWMEKELVFLGMVGMRDPVRPEVGPAIEQARRAGVRTVMITGDYKDTAVAVAKELNLLRRGSKVLTGQELNALTDDELTALVETVDVYTRVSPEHKVRIVEALKCRGAVVAMTGDGVNDAPALKRSHIGVAMGVTGTDVARETADMVLTDDNYASIVSAIEQGRVIYDNIRKFVFYLLSCNVGEILIIFTAILAGLPSPLAPIHLLWLNLVTDGLPALALGLEKGEPDIMERPPRPPEQPILTRDLWTLVGVQALIDMVVTVGAFVWAMNTSGNDLVFARTVAFTTLVMSELVRAYTSRSERHSVFKLGPLTNRWMVGATLSSLILLLIVVYLPFLQPVFNTVPLDLSVWLVVIPLMLMPGTGAEIAKFFLRRRPPGGGEGERSRRPVAAAGEAG
ncbi:MAG: cation-translocating P-type ATPase [Anaerolineae bacterium]